MLLAVTIGDCAGECNRRGPPKESNGTTTKAEIREQEETLHDVVETTSHHYAMVDVDCFVLSAPHTRGLVGIQSRVLEEHKM
jgi:hypothetical protein